jgi:hypothetical protein
MWVAGSHERRVEVQLMQTGGGFVAAAVRLVSKAGGISVKMSESRLHWTPPTGMIRGRGRGDRGLAARWPMGRENHPGVMTYV